MASRARPRAAVVASALLAGALLLAAALGPAAQGRTGPAASRTRAAARATTARIRAYSAAVTYLETRHGHLQGAARLGIQGHGTFSLALSPLTRTQVSLLAAASGVPLLRIARGGTYTVARQIDGDGTITGTAVAKFAATSLGTVCVSYTESPGVFVPGMSFIPMSGSMTIVGGSGAAAGWRLRVSFAQTALSGWYIERVQAGGSAKVGTGAAQPMTPTCRSAARITPKPVINGPRRGR
jgi:hypothetical protein